MNKACSLLSCSSQFGERQVSKQKIIIGLINAMISVGSYVSAGEGESLLWVEFCPPKKDMLES